MSDNLVREVILENYRHPQNNTKPLHYSHSHKLANYSCGDEITVYLELAAGVVKRINYEISGCALAIATASLLSTELIGTPITKLTELDEQFVQEILGEQLSINRVKCAMLSLRTIQQAAEVLPKAASF